MQKIPHSGTNDDAIIQVVTSRTNEQRQQIRKAYKTSYGDVSNTFIIWCSNYLGQ